MKETTQKLFADGTKVLVVYFSHSGNIRKIAPRIHQVAGADMEEIEPVAPSPRL